MKLSKLNKKRTNVIFTGSNEFPFGSAVVQRQIQLANTLLEAGYDVTVINRRGAHSRYLIKREGIKKRGIFNSISYVYCSLVPFKPSNFFIRNFLKPIGFIGEFFYIIYFKFFKNSKYIFNNSIEIHQLKYYYYLSKVLKLELIYDYVEMVSSLGKRRESIINSEKNNFDYLFYKYVDKIIVISSFLENHTKNVAPDILTLKIPPIIDFKYFDNFPKNNEAHNFFLFCGSAAYIDIIKFVIKSFKIISSKIFDYKLKLIINGTDSELKLVNEVIIKEKLQDKICVLSKIPYPKLISFYKTASALLIPIKKNLQDQARFPFKICEYIASKTPIITSDVPLINEYFKNEDTAYISKVDNFKDFAEQMHKISKNSIFSKEVGKKAYKMGIKIFDYRVYTKKLDEFLLL